MIFLAFLVLVAHFCTASGFTSGLVSAPQTVAFSHSANNTISLDHAEAGQVAYFFIQPRDVNGTDLNISGLKFNAILDGPAYLNAQVYYYRDGVYQGVYIPYISGMYSLSIDLEADAGRVAQPGPIKNSPFYQDVIPGPSVVQRAVAFGEELHHCETDVECIFFVTAHDRYNNPVNQPGEYFYGLIKGPDCTFTNMTDLGNGTYALRYTVEEEGDYKVTIVSQGIYLNGSPFDLVIENRSSGGGLSGGAIAGIVIGCVAFVVIVFLVIGGAIWYMRRKRMQQQTYDSVS